MAPRNLMEFLNLKRLHLSTPKQIDDFFEVYTTERNKLLDAVNDAEMRATLEALFKDHLKLRIKNMKVNARERYNSNPSTSSFTTREEYSNYIIKKIANIAY